MRTGMLGLPDPMLSAAWGRGGGGVRVMAAEQAKITKHGSGFGALL